MGKCIFVANRLPYELKCVDEQWQSKRAVSGLVSGVLSIFAKKQGIWLGWAGQPKEICEQNRDILRQWEKEGFVSIDIPDDILVEAHEKFNNRALWSLFHNFITYVDFERSEWEAYKEYNRLFALCVIDKYEKGDLIFVNDFQLLLVPKYIKEVIPDAKIAYFHHIVFPPADVFHTLPVAKELLEGVLCADVIQFHTKKHVKNFREACEEVGLEITSTVEDNPIGIDPEQFQKYFDKESAVAKAKWMEDCFWNKKIICSVERIDPIKGIIERLLAYESMLDKNPEFRENVVLVQVAVGSREKTELYQSLHKEIDQLVGKINGKYNTLNWQPVRYINTGFNQRDLAILYSVSDVACITSLSDGFNLVALEYCASELYKKDRTLILSKFTGAADYLKDAIIVNPYDYEDVGDKLAYALENGGEGMMSKLQETIRQNTIYDWANRLFNSL